MLSKNIELMKQEVALHIEQDRVVSGLGDYWNGEKGCFIGCLVHSESAADVAAAFGMPESLTKICESIFEGLEQKEAVQFFADVPNAIGTDNKDLSLVHWQFLHWALLELPKAGDEIQSKIDPVIAGIGKLADGGEWSKEDAIDALKALDADTLDFADPLYFVVYAARSAARAAKAEAADFADFAAHAYAPRAARQKQAAKLLAIIQSAPMGSE